MALREKLFSIFRIKDTPHRLAAAFAVGLFIGMSPLLGLHTVLGIFAAWALRLNKMATIVGVYVTNPWTIIPIYTFSTWAGAKCLGLGPIMPHIDWKHLTLANLLNEFRPMLLPFIAGSLLVGGISAIVGYIVIYRIAGRFNG